MLKLYKKEGIIVYYKPVDLIDGRMKEILDTIFIMREFFQIMKALWKESIVEFCRNRITGLGMGKVVPLSIITHLPCKCGFPVKVRAVQQADEVALQCQGRNTRVIESCD